MGIEIITELKEEQLSHYFCIFSGENRYDITIAYSAQFYGKAMVTSIQTGNMVLLCQGDIRSDQFWAPKLGIATEDVPDFYEFFDLVLQTDTFSEQY